MSEFSASGRTTVLFWLYSAVLTVAVAFIVALIIYLAGYFIAGWHSAPVPQIGSLLLYAAVPMIVLRLALSWSIRVDRRERT